MEEETQELVVRDEDKFAKDFKLLTNDAIINQLVLLSKTLRSHYEIGNDERNMYIQLLKFYDKIVYMNIDLLSLAILYISRNNFNTQLTFNEKKGLEDFIINKVIPFMDKQKDTAGGAKSKDENMKANITINFISYLTSLTNYISPNL